MEDPIELVRRLHAEAAERSTHFNERVQRSRKLTRKIEAGTAATAVAVAASAIAGITTATVATSVLLFVLIGIGLMRHNSWRESEMARIADAWKSHYALATELISMHAVGLQDGDGLRARAAALQSEMLGTRAKSDRQQ